MLLLLLVLWCWDAESGTQPQVLSASSAHMLRDHYDADVAAQAEKTVQKLLSCFAA
jgi:hypothetical protein